MKVNGKEKKILQNSMVENNKQIWILKAKKGDCE